MRKENKKITFLVTGGAGFIGSNIVERLLNEGYKVRVLDNLITGKIENISEFLNNKNFEFIKGDIRDIDTCMKACEKVDYVLHEAALGSVPRSINNPLLTNEINVSGTLNMLYSAKENNVKRFIYASSSSVYGDSLELPKKEGKEGNVLSPYAATKKIDEIYADVFKKVYGLSIIGLRYFNVYGPKQDPNSIYSAVIPLFINGIMENKQVTINGDGETSRDFTYVEDVVQANIKACLSNEKYSGNVYNIAYGGRTTLNDLYHKIAETLNSDIKPIYSETRKGDIKHSNADITKASNDLLYLPKFNIDLGLKKTIDWYIKKKN